MHRQRTEKTREARLTLLTKAVVLCLSPIAVLFVSLLRYPSPNPSRLESIFDALSHLVATVHNVGFTGVCLYAFNYIASVGVIMAISICTLRWWSIARGYCFWIVSMTVTLLYMYPRWANGPYILLSHYPAAQGRRVMVDHWVTFLVGYNVWLLPFSLVLGWIASFVFSSDSRRWLARGMCPKCHYDLQGKTDAGCPECGWNRPVAPCNSAAAKHQSDES